MKTKIIKFAAILIIALITGQSVATARTTDKKHKQAETDARKKIMLFNGKDLSNWVFTLKDKTVDPTSVFMVHDGVIHITGEPFGYMRTKEAYSDYKLHVEWRWPVEASNSGVFVNAQQPDTIWLKCVECQLKAGSAGDFVCMNGADMAERADKSKRSVTKLADSSEKPVGQWNTLEVVCKSNTIELTVNGVVQNKGTNVTVTSGSICLQSEGKAVEFRNVFLNKLQ
jgi:hypothetical protein